MAEFKMDKHPYRYLQELREAYAQKFVEVMNDDLDELREEMETWMKANAPWQDRTQEERRLASKSKREMYRRGARQELKVKIINRESIVTDTEFRTSKNYLAAIKSDEETLNRLNQEQEFKKYQRMQKTTTRSQRLRVSEMFKPLSQLPKSKSLVSYLERQFRSNKAKSPLATIWFGHREHNVRYGIWLEIANQGRWGIIKPTRDRFMPKLMQRVQRLANLVQYHHEVPATNKRTELERFERVKAEGTAAGKPYKEWSAAEKAERARRRPEYVRYVKKHGPVSQIPKSQPTHFTDMSIRPDGGRYRLILDSSISKRRR